MSKSLVQTVHELGARLREQATEMDDLRAALDVQFKRIAQMQSELDLLPQARRRRQSVLALQSHDAAAHNGDGQRT